MECMGNALICQKQIDSLPTIYRTCNDQARISLKCGAHPPEMCGSLIR